MKADQIKFMDYVRIVKPEAKGIIKLDPNAIAAINYYEGAIGRVVGRASGEHFNIWFPVPGYPEPKAQCMGFRPVNLELVRRNDSWDSFLEQLTKDQVRQVSTAPLIATGESKPFVPAEEQAMADLTAKRQ